MQVRPYLGAILEPNSGKYNSNPAAPLVNPTPPNVNFSLEHAYGYTSFNTRQNLFFNSFGDIVFPTAALGVIQGASAS